MSGLISQRPQTISLVHVLLGNNPCSHYSPVCRYPIPTRSYATSNGTKLPVKNVAVLGGGITGLASAFYIARSMPNVSIDLFESSERLGGWLNSTSVDIGSGNVVFEQGPRNLRPTTPNGLITLDLVRDLGMEDRIISTSKSSPAAQNRFIYYPDHLVRMPGPGMSLIRNLMNVWSEPVFSGFIRGTLTEVVKRKRPTGLSDESVGSFLSRRLGSGIADNIASAVFHGIYAGDIYKLSVRSILPRLWHTEQLHGSIVRGAVDQVMGGLRPIGADDSDTINLRKYEDVPTSEVLESTKKASVFTFKDGIGELAHRLEEDLKARTNVTIHMKAKVDHIHLEGHGNDGKIKFACHSPDPSVEDTSWDFSHVISTISSSVLASAVPSTTPLLPLFQTQSVTVMVVNLFYSSPAILPVSGFGYLLPRSLPFEQNPERALGVVFDTDASIGQDAVSGTKVTVMLGGHWWDDFSEYPDEEHGARMAKAVLKRHLGICAEAVAVRVGLQRNCIPQYTVGHDQRMEQASHDLEVFEGRLRVAGNSYTGVGLNDCIRAARDVATGLVNGSGRTGLESFVGGRKWIWVPPTSLRNTG